MILTYVRCSRCGSRVSNLVTVVDGTHPDIVVRAFVECPECIEARGDQMFVVAVITEHEHGVGYVGIAPSVERAKAIAEGHRDDRFGVADPDKPTGPIVWLDRSPDEAISRSNDGWPWHLSSTRYEIAPATVYA
jgi:hypothetical protein